ncbi:hypothetical protein MPC4_300037 [Methylocella tundrae]|uniref:Uncharacterized protein n=1 Tax=Methylocella tundrae TaxID=227605 RepID=A0A8B6M8J7_METTU|nr:hypothetical protein MPC1_860003 [Methylocella tundrae]VTZ51117.1 hypothetical protein MPC4_300037 [Methylocella tundrae]
MHFLREKLRFVMFQLAAVAAIARHGGLAMGWGAKFSRGFEADDAGFENSRIPIRHNA